MKFEWSQFLGSRNPTATSFDGYSTDFTIEKCLESKDFTPIEDKGTRFAAPKNWIVENFSIPNGNDGTKAGLDHYSSSYSLMLGIWEDRNQNENGSLTNARIYRKIHLDKGIIISEHDIMLCIISMKPILLLLPNFPRPRLFLLMRLLMPT